MTPYALSLSLLLSANFELCGSRENAALPENVFPSPSKARRETEIKLRVSDPVQLRRRLNELGFVLRTPRHWERNALFDFPDRRLARLNKMLRLRIVPGEATLTWKERPREVGGHKSRDELETGVGAAAQLRSVLERLGLIAVAHYRKYRTEYSVANRARRGRAPVLAFDETAAGAFVELEGPQHWIDSMAKQLGYSRKDYITLGYLQLLGDLHRPESNLRAKRRRGARNRLIS